MTNCTDNDKKYHKVKDHCQNAGKFRGAHTICNLRYKNTKKNSNSIS